MAAAKAVASWQGMLAVEAGGRALEGVPGDAMNRTKSRRGSGLAENAARPPPGDAALAREPVSAGALPADKAVANDEAVTRGVMPGAAHGAKPGAAVSADDSRPGDGTCRIDGCGQFIDENGDGICDICGGDGPQRDGDGNGRKGPKGPRDGSCGKGRGPGDGTGPIDGCGQFIDENGDGICDICGTDGDCDGDGPKGPRRGRR